MILRQSGLDIAESHSSPCPIPLLVAAFCVGMLLPMPSAADTQVPWECSNYSGDAQTRCMQALIEVQREQIGQLQGELKAQHEAIGQLREQVERQAATTAGLQQQLSQPPAVVQSVPPIYAYPPAGVGIYPGVSLYLGRHWGLRYGPYLGVRPYLGYGYPLFGPCRRHWRGCW